jgi:hypothetical protein
VANAFAGTVHGFKDFANHSTLISTDRRRSTFDPTHHLRRQATDIRELTPKRPLIRICTENEGARANLGRPDAKVQATLLLKLVNPDNNWGQRNMLQEFIYGIVEFAPLAGRQRTQNDQISWVNRTAFDHGVQFTRTFKVIWRTDNVRPQIVRHFLCSIFGKKHGLSIARHTLPRSLSTATR